jgi:hypothetical protein
VLTWVGPDKAPKPVPKPASPRPGVDLDIHVVTALAEPAAVGPPKYCKVIRERERDRESVCVREREREIQFGPGGGAGGLTLKFGMNQGKREE